jgi:hypothetical protein
MRDNGQMQTKVCSQTKGVQSVDVISEERFLGKISARHVSGLRQKPRARS